MTIPYRVLLVAGAVLILIAMMRKIRKSEVKISDSLFWFFFVVTLIVLAVFPGIAFYFSAMLGVESPANLVFLYVIAVLLIREFMSTAEISQLRSKVIALTQESALDKIDEADKSAECD